MFGDGLHALARAVSNLFGTIDMGFTGAPTASRDYGPLGLISGPYVFRDYDHWKRYRDSDVFKEIMEAYNETSGIHAVAAVYYGTRQVTSNKTIREPADMEGLKLRVPNFPLYLLFPRSVGANPRTDRLCGTLFGT